MGEVGTRLAFENARVKVWAGSTLEVTRASGRVDTVTLRAGRVYFPGGARHPRDQEHRCDSLPRGELKKPGLAR